LIQRLPSHERKTYVLDSNIFLHEPYALFAFEEHEVVVPITVVEEVDRFKKDQNEKGRNARQFSRYLDQLSERGDLATGVELESGGLLRVDLVTEVAPEWTWASGSQLADNLILSVAYKLNQEAKVAGRVVMVSKDTNVRIKANALGIRSEDYEHGKVKTDELYTGQGELTVAGEVIDELFRTGEATVPGLTTSEEDPDSEHVINECFVLRNAERPNQTALGRLHGDGKIHMVRPVKEGVYGIFPRNKEQFFAIDLLLDDDIKVVTLVGKAGTGKTLLAIAAGLAKSADDRVYDRLLVSRPIFPLGRDIGFLPGDISDKLNPWMKPVYDNVEFILHSRSSVRGKQRAYQELISQGLLEIEPLTYIRGRSIPHQYLVVDEAQNLTPHEIKTIITRAGEGTKIVLTGDPYQIDNPYVDATSNGLVYLVERFRNSKIAGHVTLSKGERSELAELAAELL
jgi:PhoH-like ATPase